MKKILVPTDFSVPAENAAKYAISLAKGIKANVIICNAFKVPAEAPMAAQVAWPLISYEEMETETNSNLDELVKKLADPTCDTQAKFCPEITYQSEKGDVCEVISELVKKENIELVVMGMAGAGKVVQLVLGSNSKAMIDAADFPVLYVPYVAKFKELKKIVFATDLSTDDLEPLQFLVRLAAPFNAEIFVFHITNYEKNRAEELEHKETNFLDKVISKLDYPHVKYENIWHHSTIEGLKWIEDQKQVDIIALVHQQHSFFDTILNGTNTKKLSRYTEIPLLVFQPIAKVY